MIAGTSQRSRIVLVNVETGAEQVLGDGRFDVPGALTRLPDASALIVDAAEHGAGPYGTTGLIWSVAYPGGAVRRITNDLASYASVGALPPGSTLCHTASHYPASSEYSAVSSVTGYVDKA